MVMNRTLPGAGATLVLLSVLILTSATLSAQIVQHQHHGVLDTALIDRTFGTSGSWNAEEGVYKISFPRTDVKVEVDGISMPPFMGLTTWVGFQEHGDSAMVMGDLVLFQDEVNPVMSVLLDGGVSVTALHNHFFYSEPVVYFMHVGGDAKLVDLVRTIWAALDKERTIRAQNPAIATTFGSPGNINSSDLTASLIDPVLNLKGSASKGMLKYVVGRTVTMPGGGTMGAEMGVNTWAAFMGSADHAVIDGDFATSTGELQPVLKALRHSDIDIVAIHSHMEGETPHLIFLHFWGIGNARQLASGFRSALNAQAAAAGGAGQS